MPMTATDVTLCALLGFMLVDTMFHLMLRRPPPLDERPSAVPDFRTETR
jgi:hypothetical protein